MAEKVEKKQGFGTKVKKYLSDCKAELKKVTWPTKDQLVRNSLVIIAFIALITVVLSVLDAGFGWIFTKLTEIL